jgi:uroporphyrinogen decarboxylase
MTSRERVLSAIAHEETDRVPIDFWAEDVVWARLMRDLGLPTKRSLLERFHVDLRWTDHKYVGPDFSDPRTQIRENMWGERFRVLADGTQVASGGALDHAQSFFDIENHHWPSNDWVRHDHLRDQIRRDEEYAILYGYADIWQRVGMVRGLGNMFVDMIERPDWVDFMTGKLTGFYLEDWTRAMEAADGRIDIFFLISDLGAQNGPLMSLGLFRRFIKPRIEQMADLVHSFGKKLLFHSCGSVRLYIDDFIDAGVDILNPIQPSCAGMNPKELKAAYGNRLCFHGGMDVQTVLPHGTPDEVRAATRQLIQTMKPGGGFILCPSHTLLPDIPIENIEALYEEALEV